jgi:DNA-binding IclR family transcriptional regulator
VLYIEKISGHRRVVTGSRLGGRLPAHCTAVGKAIMAASPPEVLEGVIANGLARRTAFTITVPNVLRRQLAHVTRAGVAYEREESGPNVTCVASPVFGYGNRVVAALSVTGPVGRLDPERFASTVRLAAFALTRRLGGQPGTATGAR